MDKNFLIQFTNNLYRLTLLFPKKEPLRYKMRELADEILADLVSLSKENPKENPRSTISTIVENVDQNLEVLNSFFEVAKAQNWVSLGNLLAIQQGYSKIKEGLDRDNREKEETIGMEIEEKVAEHETVPQYPFFQDQEKKTSVRSNPVNREAIPVEAGRTSNGVNERQKRILEILKEREKIQVCEIRGVFPQVTKRTLRRDFEQMLKQGLIKRIGEKNNTFYQI